MKTTLNLLLLLLAFNVQYANSQLDTISSGIFVSTNGTFFNEQKLSVSYSIGESVISSVNYNGLYLTQGFYQQDLCDLGPVIDPPVPVISLFPNPFRDNLSAEFLTSSDYQNFKVEIFNLRGCLVSLKEYNGIFYGERKSLDTDMLSSGIYFVNITSLDGKFFKKYKVIKI